MPNGEALTETVVFMTHAIKRMMYAFERLAQIADVAEPGSAMPAFYMDGVYGYIAAFFLLANGRPGRQGSFRTALEPHNLENLLNGPFAVLEERFGGTTFGEVLRVFRNNALVHPTYRDADMDRIYAQVNMLDDEVRADYQARLERLKDACGQLAFDLADAAHIDPEQLGFRRA